MWQLDHSCFEFPLLWWSMLYCKSLCVVFWSKFALQLERDLILFATCLLLMNQAMYLYMYSCSLCIWCGWHLLVFVVVVVVVVLLCFGFLLLSSSFLRYINIHLLCCLYLLLLLKSGRSNIYFLCPLLWRLKQVEFVVIILFPTLLSENWKCNSYGKIRSMLMIWFNNKRWKPCKLLHH